MKAVHLFSRFYQLRYGVRSAVVTWLFLLLFIHFWLQLEIETHFGRYLSSCIWVLQIVLKWYEVSKMLGICQQSNLKEKSNYIQSMLGSNRHEAMGRGAFPSTFRAWSRWMDRHPRGKMNNKEIQGKKILYLPVFENCGFKLFRKERKSFWDWSGR